MSDQPSHMSAYNFLEREASYGPIFEAMAVAELQGAAEHAVEAFKEKEGLEEYVALCHRLAEWEPINFDREKVAS